MCLLVVKLLSLVFGNSQPHLVLVKTLLLAVELRLYFGHDSEYQRLFEFKEALEVINPTPLFYIRGN